MTPEARQRRREALARAAQGRSRELSAQLERLRGLPAAPGDLFVLPATADLPVQWAVLDRRAGAPGALLAVPADDHPLVGSADVAVGPHGAPVLRCRFGLWLDAALFDPDLRSGVLPAEVVAAALLRCRQVEAGEVHGSPLAEEADADPEYGDWIREVPERAHGLAARAQPAGTGARLRRTPVWIPALAAALVLVSVGLSIRVYQLDRRLEELSAPVVGLPAQEVYLSGGQRGETKLTIPPGASRVFLLLPVDPFIDSKEVYLELTRHTGEVVLRSPRIRLTPTHATSLELSRPLLPDGLYRLRLYPEAGFKAKPLVEKVLRVETLEEGGG